MHAVRVWVDRRRGQVGRGDRVTRTLGLLLLLMLTLTVVKYIFVSILDASPIRTYHYTPLYIATQSTIRPVDHLPWPNALQVEKAHNTNNRPNPIHTDATWSVAPTKNTLLVGRIMDIIKNSTTTAGGEFRRNETGLPLCDSMPQGPGPIPVNKTYMELDEVEKKYPEVQWGGRYSPPNCTARHKVAIIVSYRDRQQQLPIFLNHMHSFLMKQQIEYGIFIIEQAGTQKFNRAKLMNVGFVESQKQKPGGWQCFIFHDIDMLPVDQRNLYSCPRQPRHMSAALDTFYFILPYKNFFGGVSALTLDQFMAVNGFSNRYWGWGGEDNDMARRLRKMKYNITRYEMSIARYITLKHKKAIPNPKRRQLVMQAESVFKKDGLSSLQYKLVGIVHHHLYTHIVANIDEHS